MTTLEHLRNLLEDNPAPEHEISIATGDESEFFVSNPPITNGVVKLDGLVQTLGVDYTIGLVSGVAIKIVFNSLPVAGTKVEIEYTRQTWTDAELLAYLGLATIDWAGSPVGIVYQAAILALDSTLTGAATALNFGAGDENADMASVFDRLTRLRAVLSGHLAAEARRPLLLAPSPPPV